MTQGRKSRMRYAFRFLFRSREIVYKSPSRVQLCSPSFSSLWQLYSLTHTTTPQGLQLGGPINYSRTYVTLFGLFQHIAPVKKRSRREVGKIQEVERSPVAKPVRWTSDHLYHQSIPLLTEISAQPLLPGRLDLGAQRQILRPPANRQRTRFNAR